MLKKYIFPILIVFFIAFSMWPTVYELQNKDTIREDRYFELVHNFYTDFNFYLSRIRQGLEGKITVHEKYTSEPHAGGLIHIMYLSMGWVGRWVRVPWHRTADIYHMARIVLAALLLVLTYEIVKKSFSGFFWKLTSFLFAVTASTYPILVRMDNGALRIGGHMAWWSVMDSLQRITFIPHLLAGQSLMAAVLLLGSDMRALVKPGNWFFLGFLMFVLGIIFPPGFVFVTAVYGFMVLLELFLEPKKPTGNKLKTWLLTHILPRFVIVLIGLPALFYLSYMTSFYPWKELALQDVLHPLPFKYPEYLLAVGVMLPLGGAGMIWALRRREKAMFLPSSWVLAWTALLIIFNWVPSQSPLRFSEMIVHVPLGILAAYFFKMIYSSIDDIRKKQFKKYQYVKNLAIIFPIIIIIINLMHMQSSYLWQRDFVNHKIRGMLPLVPTGSYVMYPLKDFINAIRWIQDHTSRDTVILCETTSGNYIPVYAGNYVYVGHANTVNKTEKKLYVKSFFSASMPGEQAYRWLKEERLEYVFFGPQEKEDGGISDLSLNYPFLERVYEQGHVIIYRIR